MAVALTQDRVKTYAGFVRLEHTVFSLPVIFSGVVLQRRGWPEAMLVVWLLLAAVGARVMAMGLNRLIDAKIDVRNPRTKPRELPSGAMQHGEAWAIVALAASLYLFSAAMIAPICLWLSPIPVALFVLYPYLKRFTSLAHLGLGLAWSMGPLAGWLAAAQSLRGISGIGWLWLFSVLWVTGFDIIYATMDEAFDRTEGLHALPARIGRRPALRVAAVLHAGAFAALCLLWFRQLHSDAVLIWLAAIGVLLVWQHAIAERNPAFAFFQLNGALGFLVFGLVATGV